MAGLAPDCVMAGLVPAIHDWRCWRGQRRGWPGPAMTQGGRPCRMPHSFNAGGLVPPIVSWPAWCRPSTTGGAGEGEVVGGRARPGHDTVGTTVPCAPLI